jgi:DNA-binding response OmpR family regulator
MVDSYSDSCEALKNFRPRHYGLALLDIRMPGISGFQLAKGLRETDPKIVICYLTALDIVDEEYQQIFPNETPDYLVKKPSLLSNLVKAVKKQLESTNAFLTS